MFTGIVQDLSRVISLDDSPGGGEDIRRLTLDLGHHSAGLELGASVAVNGTCLTVTSVNDAAVTFDVIPQTLRMTNLGELAVDAHVNVERSFRVGDEIGGHIVSGHVSGTTQVLERRVQGGDHVLRMSLDPLWSDYVFDKGFVALDGASLTISALSRSEGWFEVSLIPETLNRTTLGRVEGARRINVEVDAQTRSIVETVERVLQDSDALKRMLPVAALKLS